jgi:hypothetical protein
MKVGWSAGRQMAVLPEDVRTGQRGMATEGDLDSWGEPAQIKTIRAPAQKRRLGEVHLTCHVLHPLGFTRRRQDAHRGRIAGKWGVGKGVYLYNA